MAYRRWFKLPLPVGDLDYSICAGLPANWQIFAICRVDRLQQRFGWQKGTIHHSWGHDLLQLTCITCIISRSA